MTDNPIPASQAQQATPVTGLLENQTELSALALPSPAEAAAELEQALFEIKRVIVGQDHMVERLLVALLARGHILLEGLPGVAKTLAVSTLAQVIGGDFVRLQFTPDLLPSDLIGTRIWRSSSETFDTEWGPVFTNLLLTDEINRAPAKVQSALLEVMAERQVSIGGETKPLPAPFLVLATQNPIESEGVYTLPEAQRDRFLMKVTVDYPTPAEELEIVRRMGTTPPSASQVLTLDRLMLLQQAADAVYVDSGVSQYAVDLVMATREPNARGLPELDEYIEFGVSPRATLGLVAAGRSLALLRGRGYVTPQDIFDVARDVLRHRLMLSYEALAKSLSVDDVLNRLLAVIPAAAVSPREMQRPLATPTSTASSTAQVAPQPQSAAPSAPSPRSVPPTPQHEQAPQYEQASTSPFAVAPSNPAPMAGAGTSTPLPRPAGEPSVLPPPPPPMPLTESTASPDLTADLPPMPPTPAAPATEFDQTAVLPIIEPRPSSNNAIDGNASNGNNSNDIGAS